MCQYKVADRLVCHAAYFFDDFFSQPRCRLRLDDHHAFVADDHAGVWIAFGCEGPEVFAHFVKRDFLFGHVALGCECFCHGVSFRVRALAVGSGPSGGGLFCEMKFGSGVLYGGQDCSCAIAEPDLVAVAFGGSAQGQCVAVFDKGAGLSCVERERFAPCP